MVTTANEVERVARALCVHNGVVPDYDLAHKTGKNWELWADDARVAIRAMKAPTP